MMKKVHVACAKETCNLVNFLDSCIHSLQPTDAFWLNKKHGLDIKGGNDEIQSTTLKARKNRCIYYICDFHKMSSPQKKAHFLIWQIRTSHQIHSTVL